jgi:methylmalonyl-CoA mutase cobalamin-binding subunit
MHLERSSLDLSQPRLLDEVLVPLIHQIGELWENGTLRIAHEHMASVVVRSFLTNLQTGFSPSPTAPAIVVCTPPRQIHELGALLVTATAASEGWRVFYLGLDCPIEEIAAVVLLKRASAVALSIVYPNDDPYLSSDLRKLRRLVGDELLLLVGGRSAIGYSDVLKEIAATYASDMKEVRQHLRLQRSD